MNTLKCKICGGNILLTGESHGICDSCGSEITLPKIDDDKRVDMYNRGNHFRQIGDFDRAYSAYEHIIADDRNDAEAHWCLTLCRYGVEYVKDVRSGAYKPTVSRMNFERVLDDPDFQAALNCSDDYTKLLYTKEAQKIDNIQRRYLEISRQEQPYDVFICFKAEDTDGQRTQASVLSQEIYEKLTAKGLNVFFSRISLESKLSEEYEPYIFAALHSATVMLLVSDKPEQLTARWVKNEWSRYLAMMDRDSNKHMIPVFINMSPYDFPPEIPTVQGQDMSRVGAMQDLVRGVCKITNHLQETSSSPLKGAFSIQNCLNRIKIAVEDGEFDVASRLIEDVLNNDSENGEAYYYRLISKYELKYLPLDDCDTIPVEKRKALIEDQYFQRAVQYGSEERKQQLKEFVFRDYELQMHTWIDNVLQQKTIKSNNQAKKIIESLVNEAAAKNGNELYYKDHLENLKERCTVQRKKLDILTTYWNEIGNPLTYVKREVDEKYPEESKHLEGLRNSYYKFAYFEEGSGWFILVCAILLSALCIYLTRTDVYWYVGTPTIDDFVITYVFFLGWFFLIVSIWFMWMSAYSKEGISFDWEFLMAGFITFVVFVITLILIFVFNISFEKISTSEKFYSYFTIIFRWLPCAMTVFYVYCIIQTRMQKKLKKESSKYVSKVIAPIADSVILDTNNRWAGVIGKDNLYSLANYDGYFQQEVNLIDVYAPVSGEIVENNINNMNCNLPKGFPLVTIQDETVQMPCDGYVISSTESAEISSGNWICRVLEKTINV